MKLLTHIPSWLKNKYLLASAAFLVWMFFFDKNDLFTQYGRLKHSIVLQKNEARQGFQIANTRRELDLLKTNARTIEEYAREKYMMKKDNEDLFIVKYPSESK